MTMLLLAAAAFAQQSTTTPYIQPSVQAPPAPKVTPRPQRGRANIAAQGTGEPIRGIVFEGVEAPSPVAEAAKAFIGRPATRETLVELAGALSRAYERTDIALYTVTIPDQDFSEGVVTVNLVEGWVNAIQIKAPAGQNFPLAAKMAGKVVGAKPLPRGLYERAGALMEAIPGVKVQQALENPENDDSVVWVLTPRQRRVEVAAGVNNRGPNLLGDVVLNAGIDFNRMFTPGDQLSFTAAATPNLHNYRALEGAYALPIGADGLRLTATGAAVRTRARHFDIEGRAYLAALTLTYPILRRSTRAADLSFGVDGVNSRNALFGNIFATERSRAARLAGAYVSAGTRHTFTGSATLSHGLDIFGARITEPNGETGFTKFAAAATYEHLLGRLVYGRVNLTGQYSRDRLPAAELFSVGGPSIGRAFDTGILTGDRGLGGFVELAVRPIKNPKLAKSEAYVFGDAATLSVHGRGIVPGQSFSLASAGAGVRARFKDRFQLGVEGAAVLDRPYAGYDDHWRLSVFYNVTF